MKRMRKAHGRVLASQINLDKHKTQWNRSHCWRNSGSSNEAKTNTDQKEALHESAFEAAATTQEEIEVANKTHETGPETAAAPSEEKEFAAVESHDELPQQKTSASNEEKAATSEKSHDKSPQPEAAATQQKTRADQK